MSRQKKPDWYPFYPDEYARDTAHLDAADHGIYRLLIDRYYVVGGALSGTPRSLLKDIRLSPTRRNCIKMEIILHQFFIQTDEKWTHARCEIELEVRRNRIEKGRKAAEKRWGTDANPSEDGMLTHDANPYAKRMVYTVTDTVLERKEDYATSRETEVGILNPAPGDAGRASGSPLDLKNQVWAVGLKYLTRAGVPERRAAGILGRWRRDYLDVDILNALAASEAEASVEPIAFVNKCLNNGRNMRNGNQPRPARPSDVWRSEYAAHAKREDD